MSVPLFHLIVGCVCVCFVAYYCSSAQYRNSSPIVCNECSLKTEFSKSENRTSYKGYYIANSHPIHNLIKYRNLQKKKKNACTKYAYKVVSRTQLCTHGYSILFLCLSMTSGMTNINIINISNG